MDKLGPWSTAIVESDGSTTETAYMESVWRSLCLCVR